MKYILLAILVACGQPKPKPATFSLDDTTVDMYHSSTTWTQVDTLIRFSSISECGYDSLMSNSACEWSIIFVDEDGENHRVFRAILRRDTLTIVPSGLDSLFKRAKVVLVAGAEFKKQKNK